MRSAGWAVMRGGRKGSAGRAPAKATEPGWDAKRPNGAGPCGDASDRGDSPRRVLTGSLTADAAGTPAAPGTAPAPLIRAVNRVRGKNIVTRPS